MNNDMNKKDEISNWEAFGQLPKDGLKIVFWIGNAVGVSRCTAQYFSNLKWWQYLESRKMLSQFMGDDIRNEWIICEEFHYVGRISDWDGMLRALKTNDLWFAFENEAKESHVSLLKENIDFCKTQFDQLAAKLKAFEGS